MAEAERIIGTPGSPDAARAGQQRPGDDAAPQERSGAEAARSPADGSGTDAVDTVDAPAERPRGGAGSPCCSRSPDSRTPSI
ncbi:hypothetical protein GCM10020295_62230 [Streptomyces cinereospinus]